MKINSSQKIFQKDQKVRRSKMNKVLALLEVELQIKVIT